MQLKKKLFFILFSMLICATSYGVRLTKSTANRLKPETLKKRIEGWKKRGTSVDFEEGARLLALEKLTTIKAQKVLEGVGKGISLEEGLKKYGLTVKQLEDFSKKVKTGEKSATQIEGGSDFEKILNSLGMGVDELGNIARLYKEGKLVVKEVEPQEEEGELESDIEELGVEEEEEFDDDDDDDDEAPPDDDELELSPKKADVDEWNLMAEIKPQEIESIRKTVNLATDEEKKLSDALVLDWFSELATMVEPGEGLNSYFKKLKKRFTKKIKNNLKFIKEDAGKNLFEKIQNLQNFLSASVKKDKLENLYVDLLKEGGGELLNGFIDQLKSVIFDEKLFEDKKVKDQLRTLLINFIVSVRDKVRDADFKLLAKFQSKIDDSREIAGDRLEAIFADSKTSDKNFMKRLAKEIDILRVHPNFLNFDLLIGKNAIGKRKKLGKRLFAEKERSVPLLLILRSYKGAEFEPDKSYFEKPKMFAGKLKTQLFHLTNKQEKEGNEEDTFKEVLEEQEQRTTLFNNAVENQKKLLTKPFSVIGFLQEKINKAKNKNEFIKALKTLANKSITGEQKKLAKEIIKNINENIAIDNIIGQMETLVGAEQGKFSFDQKVRELLEQKEVIIDKVKTIISEVSPKFGGFAGQKLYGEFTKLESIARRAKLVMTFPFRTPKTVEQFLNGKEVLGGEQEKKIKDTVFYNLIEPYGLLMWVAAKSKRYKEKTEGINLVERYKFMLEFLNSLKSKMIIGFIKDENLAKDNSELILKNKYKITALYDAFKNKNIDNVKNEFEAIVTKAGVGVEKTPCYQLALMRLLNLLSEDVITQILITIGQLNTGKMIVERKPVLSEFNIKGRTARKPYTASLKAIKGSLSTLLKTLGADAGKTLFLTEEKLQKAFESAKEVVKNKINAVTTVDGSFKTKITNIINGYLDKSLKAILEAKKKAYLFTKKQNRLCKYVHYFTYFNLGFGQFYTAAKIKKGSGYIIKAFGDIHKGLRGDELAASKALNIETFKTFEGEFDGLIKLLGNRADKLPALSKVQTELGRIKSNVAEKIKKIKVNDVLPKEFHDDDDAKESLEKNKERRVKIFGKYIDDLAKELQEKLELK